MLTSEPARRAEYIRALADLFKSSGFYPFGDELHEFEVCKLESPIVGKGGYGVCYEGRFLVDIPIAMKILGEHIRVEIVSN